MFLKRKISNIGQNKVYYNQYFSNIGLTVKKWIISSINSLDVSDNSSMILIALSIASLLKGSPL